MKKLLNPIFIYLDLQQFGEGGEGVGTADSGFATTQADNGQFASDNGNDDGDRVARFEELMNGEFKDLYEQRLQNHFDKRTKGMRKTVDSYNALAPTLELLANKYGVDVNDIEALNNAIDEDDTFFEDEALERGLTVQELKNIRKMEKENAFLKKQMEEQQSRQRADELYRSWLNEAENIKQIYPSFDLNAELDNPKFSDLLSRGIDLRTSYEVIHKDDIIRGAMTFTAQKAEQKVTNRIRANGSRPSENGLGSQVAISSATDVAKLTKEQRKAYIERARAGERITFK